MTLLYTHPYPKSFNHAILDTVIKNISEKGVKYNILDLCGDHFDSVMQPEQLKLFARGETTDPLAKKYINIIKNTKDHMIFVFPIWWGTEPAIVKGFFDKVCLKGVAYSQSPEGKLSPLLDIKKTTVFTTSEGPTMLFAPYFDKYFTNRLNSVGMKNVSWHNCDQTSTGTLKHREDFLKKVAQLVK